MADTESSAERAMENGLDAVADIGREVWKLKTRDEMRDLRRVTEVMIAKLVVTSSVLLSMIERDE